MSHQLNTKLALPAKVFLVKKNNICSLNGRSSNLLLLLDAYLNFAILHIWIWWLLDFQVFWTGLPTCHSINTLKPDFMIACPFLKGHGKEAGNLYKNDCKYVILLRTLWNWKERIYTVTFFVSRKCSWQLFFTNCKSFRFTFWMSNNL